MPKTNRTLHSTFKCVTVSMLPLLPMMTAPVAYADEHSRSAVGLLASVPVPVSKTNTGIGMFSFDISYVDQKTGVYYVADRSNKAVDALTDEKTVTQIVPNNGHGAFAGIAPPAFSTATAGPNGVVSAFPWLFVTDAPSRVLSFDLRQNPPLTVSEVQTKAGELTRADELAYDPKDGLILAINNAATPPFGTLIQVNQQTGALSVVKNIIFDAAHGVDAQNGAEQPVWDPTTGKFYLSIPQLGSTASSGAVIRLSITGTVEATYPIEFCSPAGLALGPNDDLLANCNTIWATDGSLWTGDVDKNEATAAPQLVVLDAKSGTITAHITSAGVGDEAWFNKGDNSYYAASSGSNLAPNALFPARPPVGTAATAPVNVSQGAATLDVIDADREVLTQRIPTLNVPAIPASQPGSHPSGTAHSVAAWAKTNHVFVPLGANNAVQDCLTGCITIYGRADDDDQDHHD